MIRIGAELKDGYNRQNANFGGTQNIAKVSNSGKYTQTEQLLILYHRGVMLQQRNRTQSVFISLLKWD